MLPSRPTLRGWNPHALAVSTAAINASAESVTAAVRGISGACGRMPDMQAWAGRSHDAADAMFGRADAAASEVLHYANDVAATLKNGSETIGRARTALLNKADELDAGPLNVTDQWVVLVDPVRMSADEFAELQELACEEQATVNAMLMAVGDADDATADAVAAAGSTFGFVESGPPTDLGGIMLAAAQRPPDQVPNPLTPMGMMVQEVIRAADQQQNVREVVESIDTWGQGVTTVIKQDGSKAVTTRMDPYEWPSKDNFYEMEEFDRDGNFVARTASFHDMYNDCDYTSITYADLSNVTISMDPTGHRTAGFTPAGGRSTQIPVELIDNISLTTGSGISALEKHIVHGGSLPMLTAESVENVGKAAKFGGPALEVATTFFDMAMADSDKERCIALVAGIGGAGGGWAGAEMGAALGALGGPGALYTVPAGALLGGFGGGLGGAKLGELIGEVVCPY